MAKQKVRVILDNGNEFVMVCEKVTVTRHSTTGELIKFEYVGCAKNIPLYVNLSKVAAVIQEDIR